MLGEGAMERKIQFEVSSINESRRRSRTDLEVWHHDGMPISLDKIARSEPFAGGPYEADISAYSCRM